MPFCLQPGCLAGLSYLTSRCLLRCCRLKGHILPFNSGLLAREALSHPFFGTPTIRHAEIPVPLTCVFPTAD
jgi:hypothetical protein